MQPFTFRRKFLFLVLILAGLLAPVTTQAGGWVVVTVADLPHSVTVEAPVALTFAVRQHGQRLIRLEEAAVVATHLGSGEHIRFPVEPLVVAGYHRAVLTFPQAGTWEWRFEPHPFPTQAVFAPLTVWPAAQTTHSASSLWLTSWLRNLLQQREVATAAIGNPGSTDAGATDEVAYGRALFLAKGCAACHLHEEAGMGWSTEAGPNLTHYQPDPLYMRSFLRNADSLTVDRQWPMPVLDLNDEEIDALLAFLGDGKIVLDR